MRAWAVTAMLVAGCSATVRHDDAGGDPDAAGYADAAVRADTPAARPPTTPAPRTLAAGVFDLCVVRPDGDVLWWRERPAVIRLPDGSRAVEAGCGTMFACARSAAGSVWCWGSTNFGDLGNGEVERGWRVDPVRVLDVEDAVELTIGSARSCVRHGRGGVSCWGLLGRDSADEPGAIEPGLAARPVRTLGVGRVEQVRAGRGHACALVPDGTVACWGLNAHGQCGQRPPALVTAATVVAGVADVVEVSAGSAQTCARLRSGRVVCWGANLYGQLGDGTRTSRATPAEVTGLRDAVEIEGGSGTACARRGDGSVWCWGRREYGQLGDGLRGMEPRPWPAPVVGLLDAVEVSVGATYSCARRANGAVVCWGLNSGGVFPGYALNQVIPVPTEVLPPP